MGSTLTASEAASILKERFPAGAKEFVQFNQGAAALDLVDNGGEVPKWGELDAEGTQLSIPVITKGNPNAAMPVRETRGYPTTGNQTRNKAYFNIKTFVSSFAITGLARKKAPGGAKSVLNLMESEMEHQKIDAQQRINRALHSDGSGLLATCASSASGATVTLAAVSAGSDENNVPVGREVQILNLTTGEVCGNHPSLNSCLVIGSVNFATPSAPTITLTLEDGTPANLSGITSSFGVYIREGQGGDMAGFGIMCSDANPSNWGPGTPLYGGINRTTYPFWGGYRLSAGSKVVSIQAHIQPILSRIDKRSGAKFGGKLFAFCAFDNFNAVCNSLARNQRTNYNRKLRGGYEGAQYNNCIFVQDFMAPVDKIRFIAPKSVYRYIMDPWYFEDDCGSMLERVSTSTGRPTNTFRINMLSRQETCTVQNMTMAELYSTAGSQ